MRPAGARSCAAGCRRSGRAPVREASSPCGIFYTSRFYRLLDGVEPPPLDGGIVGVDLGYLKFGIFAGDSRVFSITLAASPADDDMRRVLHQARLRGRRGGAADGRGVDGARGRRAGLRRARHGESQEHAALAGRGRRAARARLRRRRRRVDPHQPDRRPRLLARLDERLRPGRLPRHARRRPPRAGAAPTTSASSATSCPGTRCSSCRTRTPSRSPRRSCAARTRSRRRIRTARRTRRPSCARC